jgi:hypothetical protein
MNKNMTDKTVRQKTYRLIKNMGIDAGNVGFEYIIDAVAAAYKLADANTGLTKKDGVYDNVAKIHNKKPSNIERGIRHSINLLISNSHDNDVIESVFGSGNITRITNKSFIYGIMQYIIYEDV